MFSATRSVKARLDATNTSMATSSRPNGIMPMSKYLFVLSPPYSGSTLLWSVLGTSPAVSSLPREGIQVTGPEVRGTPLVEDPELEAPWGKIKKQWMEKWDVSKPILLEKSPAHIHRAAEIEEHFSPAYFLALMRDPYAFCEGCTRRKSNYSHRDSAQLWVRCAKSQRKNIETLERVLAVRYEDFTEDPGSEVQKILGFMPSLKSIRTDGEKNTFTVMGRRKEISNINEAKVKMLNRQNVESINEVLSMHRDLTAFFGYDLRDPSAHSRFRAWRNSVLAQLIRFVRWLLRKGGFPERVAVKAENVLSENRSG